jgi:hypothetical protein
VEGLAVAAEVGPHRRPAEPRVGLLEDPRALQVHPTRVLRERGLHQSTGSSGNNGAGDGSTATTGVAGNRAGASGGRIDGTVQKGPAMQGDAEISAENAKVDKKVKSICKGC